MSKYCTGCEVVIDTKHEYTEEDEAVEYVVLWIEEQMTLFILCRVALQTAAHTLGHRFCNDWSHSVTGENL